MNERDLLELIEEKRFDELENYCLEQMESGQPSVDEFLRAAKALGREKEKERAGLLLGLLAEHFLEKQNWRDRLTILKEIARHEHAPRKLEDLREQIKETLHRIYSSQPSFQFLMRHYHYDDLLTGEEFKEALKKIEWWLSHDVGEVFYLPGYGVGRVKEININLGLVRIDFELKKDVSFEMGDKELEPLPEGHILRERVLEQEKLRQEAMEDPGNVVGRLLQTLGRPMMVGEIKECFGELISADHWSRWWSAARKHPQILTSGKGTQATYAWSESKSAAEDVLKETFQTADVRTRIEMVRQHGNRSSKLTDYFRELLLQDARQAYEQGQTDVALELLELFAKRPGSVPLGYTLEDLLRKSGPESLLSSLTNPALKLKVLEEITRVFHDRCNTIFVESLLREENPRVLAFLFETLRKEAPAAVEGTLGRVMANPALASGLFTWICELAAREDPGANADPIASKLEGRFLLSVLRAIEEPEFSSHRNRLKKAVESGLLLNLLGKSMDQELAQKAIDLLEHARAIEDYRRERWRNTIRMRYPEMKEKEEFLFSTKEALERKRAELEQLITVELPKNRKAVGEAAALGDLSENFEYKAARERQDYLINRVAQLQDDLKLVRVLDPAQIDCSQVRPGTRVVLAQPDKQMAITILGPWDSNPKEAIYSYEAPMAAALLGKKPGEKTEWNEQVWVIEKIEPWM